MLTVHGIETAQRYNLNHSCCCIVATVLTVHGIETDILVITFLLTGRCNSTYRLRYAPKGARRQRSKAMMRSAHLLPEQSEGKTKMMKQQHLPFTVCAEGCEAAEEQSDDEVRTSQVPERREGKTKVIK